MPNTASDHTEFPFADDYTCWDFNGELHNHGPEPLSAIQETRPPVITLQAAPDVFLTLHEADLGDAKDIHPARKQEVGERLALAAKTLVYGKKDEYSGPQFRAATAAGNTLVLAFDHIAQGRTVQGGGELKGFTLSGPDGVFLSATARIVDSTVVVSNETIPNPTAVRYGWDNVPDVNLANTAGVPASPFRSDSPQK